MAIEFKEGHLTFTVNEELLTSSSEQLIGDLSGQLGYRLHPATSRDLVQRLINQQQRGYLPGILSWPIGTTLETRVTPEPEQGQFDKWRIYAVLPQDLGLGEVHLSSAGAEFPIRALLGKPEQLGCPTGWTISVECAAGVVSAYPCQSGAPNVSREQYASALRAYGTTPKTLFQLPEPIVGFIPPQLLHGVSDSADLDLHSAQRYGLESHALAWRKRIGRVLTGASHSIPPASAMSD